MGDARNIIVLFITMGLLFGCSFRPITESSAKVKAELISSEILEGVTNQYKSYVIGEIDQLVLATESFTNAVKMGDIEKAKDQYASTRTHFERVEPIVHVFGELVLRIDARKGDVPEEEWVGFHRIEKGLWVDNTTAGYEAIADQLLSDVQLLRNEVESMDITFDLLIVGVVDLINEVSTMKVTGEEERYSHTDLYDFEANIQGAEKIFQLLQPSLQKVNHELSDEIEKRFGDVYRYLDYHKRGEYFKSYSELDDSQIRILSTAVDALAEPLSQLGIISEGFTIEK